MDQDHHRVPDCLAPAGAQGGYTHHIVQGAGHALGARLTQVTAHGLQQGRVPLQLACTKGGWEGGRVSGRRGGGGVSDSDGGERGAPRRDVGKGNEGGG